MGRRRHTRTDPHHPRAGTRGAQPTGPDRRRWLGLAGIAGALALVGGVWLLSFTPGAPGGSGGSQRGSPVLRVDRDRLDLGDVALGEWVEAAFVVTNDGDDTLRFRRRPWVEVAAGC